MKSAVLLLLLLLLRGGGAFLRVHVPCMPVIRGIGGRGEVRSFLFCSEGREGEREGRGGSPGLRLQRPQPIGIGNSRLRTATAVAAGFMGGLFGSSGARGAEGANGGIGGTGGGVQGGQGKRVGDANAVVRVVDGIRHKRLGGGDVVVSEMYVCHTYIHTYTHTYIQTIHTYIHTHKHTYIHTHIHTYTYILH
jgi:hypothetical protein